MRAIANNRLRKEIWVAAIAQLIYVEDLFKS